MYIMTVSFSSKKRKCTVGLTVKKKKKHAFKKDGYFTVLRLLKALRVHTRTCKAMAMHRTEKEDLMVQLRTM